MSGKNQIRDEDEQMVLMALRGCWGAVGMQSLIRCIGLLLEEDVKRLEYLPEILKVGIKEEIAIKRRMAEQMKFMAEAKVWGDE